MTCFEELGDFHTAYVNPRNLVMPKSCVRDLTPNECFQKAPFCMNDLTRTNYTDDAVRRLATGPTQASLIDGMTLQSLAKKAPAVASAETMLSNARQQYLPFLEAMSGETRDREDLAMLASLILRCLIVKQCPENATDLVLPKTQAGRTLCRQRKGPRQGVGLLD